MVGGVQAACPAYRADQEACPACRADQGAPAPKTAAKKQATAPKKEASRRLPPRSPRDCSGPNPRSSTRARAT